MLIPKSKVQSPKFKVAGSAHRADRTPRRGVPTLLSSGFWIPNFEFWPRAEVD
jgi:hypothetical protein